MPIRHLVPRRLRRPCSALLTAAALLAALPAAAIEAGQPLPVLTVPGTDQAPVKLVDGQARLTYIDFWASWCGPCRQSFPWMNKMLDKYGSKGLRIVAINVDAERADAQAFLKDVPARMTLAFDPRGDAARQVGIKAMPSAVLVGADGRVIAMHAGFRSEDTVELEARIAAALGKP